MLDQLKGMDVIEIKELMKYLGRIVLPEAAKVLGTTAKNTALAILFTVLFTVLAMIELVEYLAPKVKKYSLVAYFWLSPRVVFVLKTLVHRIFYYSQNIKIKFPEFVPFGIMGL